MSIQAAAVFNEVAEKYDQTEVQFFGPIAKHLIDWMQIRSGNVVLDLGCGRGASLFAAAAAVGPTGRVVGLDAAPRMIAYTVLEASQRGLANVALTVGDAQRLPFAKGCFDVVVASLLMPFIADSTAMMKAMSRSLRSGGRLGVSFLGPLDSRWRGVYAAMGDCKPQAEVSHGSSSDIFGRQTSDECVRYALQAAGFSQVRLGNDWIQTRFKGPREWWEWTWSHGERENYVGLDDRNLSIMQAAAFREIARITDSDGGVTLTSEVRFAAGSI